MPLEPVRVRNEGTKDDRMEVPEEMEEGEEAEEDLGRDGRAMGSGCECFLLRRAIRDRGFGPGLVFGTGTDAGATLDAYVDGPATPSVGADMAAWK